ncbi:MAG: ATP-binding protein [Planctomycetota bacterium]|jgi:anti-sigma regulatory factor (Ser/Thr protein kinase)|nr:ATP-binding protein [Planctomycetota bacterium]
MTAEVHLKLTGNVDHLRITWQAAEALLELVPFYEDPVQTRYNVLLALQEAVSNVLRHGYGGPAPGSRAFIEVLLSWDGEALRVQISDEAAPFDPTEVLGAPDTEDATRIPEGGYGIHIIRAVLDHMEYAREDGKNVLTLAKSLAPVLDGV